MAKMSNVKLGPALDVRVGKKVIATRIEMPMGPQGKPASVIVTHTRWN